MRLISAADIHGRQYRMNEFLKAIVEFSPDIAVVCGDITQFGPGELAEILLNQIPIPAVAVHGNVDGEEILTYIDRSKAKNIHLKEYTYKGLKFVGLGGNRITEDELHVIESILDRDTIFVTHIPPYGILDSAILGIHAGSRDIRSLIEKKKPKLHLFGHIHENPGFEKFGETIEINCSIGKDGKGAIVDIDDEIEVKML